MTANRPQTFVSITVLALLMSTSAKGAGTAKPALFTKMSILQYTKTLPGMLRLAVQYHHLPSLLVNNVLYCSLNGGMIAHIKLNCLHSMLMQTGNRF